MTHPTTEPPSAAQDQPPQRDPASRSAAPAALTRPAEGDHTTLRLSKADWALFQTLGDSAPPRPALILSSGEHSGTRFTLQGCRLSLGRSPECDVCLENPGVSRRHAELREVGNTVTLHDLDSSNGSHLNEQRIQTPAVLKDGDLVRLGTAVLKYVEPASLNTLLLERIYRLATVDSATEAHTQRYLLEALEREVKLTRRTGRPLSVMCLDLDHFKSVNQRYGQPAGDLVLRGAAAAAQERLRGSDILGRTGGQAFVAVLPDTELQAAIELAERVRTAVAARTFECTVPVLTSGAGASGQPGATVRHKQTVSIGVTQMTPHTLDVRDLLCCAEAMLYAAQRSGRNRVSA